MKRRLGGIPHAATPLFCKVFGEFVLPARIPPDRLKGDPTPFNKGVFGSPNSSISIYLTVVPKENGLPHQCAHWFAMTDLIQLATVRETSI